MTPGAEARDPPSDDSSRENDENDECECDRALALFVPFRGVATIGPPMAVVWGSALQGQC